MTSAGQLDRARFRAALSRARQDLLAARGPEGHWVGQLSSSALATATAVTALAVVSRAAPTANLKSQMAAGLRWLANHLNPDGGWGDADGCLSNLSTTTLGWAAFGAVPDAAANHRPVIDRAERWLKQQLGAIEPDKLAPAIIGRYGKDRTFSVPILTMCALAGRLGPGRQAWRHVIPLPFELAACPHRWFAALRLPVVSYALPALIAIGQARHHHRPSPNPFRRAIRYLARPRTLRVLGDIQPGNGGFLEATPLTSFVTMSLAGSGQVDHPVTKRGAEFLRNAQRPDGSWPIDTDLATWLTTLSIQAMANSQWPKETSHSPGPRTEPQLDNEHWTLAIRAWLLAQQHRVEHPYTHSPPGGWAWTDLPGGVPDADDTAGALLALRQLGPIDDQARQAAQAGLAWLIDLQNHDGGIPTFCRGWGALPFDRSSADITAHAIRAGLAWRDELAPETRPRLERALARAVKFLGRAQRPDGAWVPLWFGNQFAPGEENPTYGTARVLCALQELAKSKLDPAGGSRPAAQPIRFPIEARDKALGWMLAAQQPDGSWGSGGQTPASVEETALAVEALARWLQPGVARPGDAAAVEAAVQKGAERLVRLVETGDWKKPSPIGFYFARLWYYERLYPLIFVVGALERANRCLFGHGDVPVRANCTIARRRSPGFQ